MKKLQLKQQGTWKEIVPVQLTEKERTLMESEKQEDMKAQKELMQEIRSKRENTPSESDIQLAQEKYDEIKPEIEEGQEYQLIAMDCILNDGQLKGILNCRVDGEHIQVRF